MDCDFCVIRYRDDLKKLGLSFNSVGDEKLEKVARSINNGCLFSISGDNLIFAGERKNNEFVFSGFIGYSLKDKISTINVLHIAESMRGRGLGSSLVNYMMREDNPRMVFCEAVPSSRGFWEKMRFVGLEKTRFESELQRYGFINYNCVLS